jgi:hypothetical protein
MVGVCMAGLLPPAVALLVYRVKLTAPEGLVCTGEPMPPTVPATECMAKVPESLAQAYSAMPLPTVVPPIAYAAR